MHPRATAVHRLALAASATVIGLMASSVPAFADVGVPIMALMAIPMWVSLLVIIPLEAYFCRRILGVAWGAALRIASVTNLASTIVGVPLTWLVVLLLQLPLQGFAAHLYAAPFPTGGWHTLQAIGFRVLGLFLGSAWLYPYESQLYWLVPASALVSCASRCCRTRSRNTSSWRVTKRTARSTRSPPTGSGSLLWRGSSRNGLRPEPANPSA